MLKRSKAMAACAAAAITMFGASAAHGQSMWPLKSGGATFTAKKGQMVTVGNPYQRSEKFQLQAFEPDYATPIDGVTIIPSQLSLGAGATRRVKIIFDVPEKERTVAVCVNPSPKEGAMVVPRVCGLYSGHRVGVR